MFFQSQQRTRDTGMVRSHLGDYEQCPSLTATLVTSETVLCLLRVRRDLSIKGCSFFVLGGSTIS